MAGRLKESKGQSIRGRWRRRLAARETRGVPLLFNEPLQGVGDFCQRLIRDDGSTIRCDTYYGNVRGFSECDGG